MTQPIPPTVWEQRAMRRALATRDITMVYKLLIAAGIPQRVLAQRSGQNQSEVSEILHGRRVMAYDVLIRIADGFGVDRGWMGLAYDRAGPCVHVVAGVARQPVDLVHYHVASLRFR